jgi:hypothetical protein
VNDVQTGVVNPTYPLQDKGWIGIDNLAGKLNT